MYCIFQINSKMIQGFERKIQNNKNYLKYCYKILITFYKISTFRDYLTGLI